MRRFNILLLATLLLAGRGTPAWADPTPSADDIINSLSKTDSSKPCEPSCRGIHAIAPAATGGTAPQAAPPPGTPGSGTLDLTVQFTSGSAGLTPSAEHVLSRLGQALTSAKLANDRFRIEGHTDTVGNPALNQTLSEQRAASVAAFLEKNFAVDASRLETVGLGEKDLAVATPDQTAEPRNRRVHIVNLGS